MKPLNEECDGRYVVVKGRLLSVRDKYNGRTIYTVAVVERNERTLCVTWFQYNTITKDYGYGKHTGMPVFVGGKVNYDKEKKLFFISAPVIFCSKEELRIVTEYTKIQGISYAWLARTAIEQAVGIVIKDWLPENIRKQNRLMKINEALFQMQFPTTMKKLERAVNMSLHTFFLEIIFTIFANISC